MKKIILFLMSMMLVLPFVIAGDIPVATQDYGLECEFPNSHFLKVDDGVLRIPCVVDTVNLSCVSVIYNLENASTYDELLQTNPDAFFSNSVNPYFVPDNNMLNVYYNKKNLILGDNYYYSVMCSGLNGFDIDGANVNINYSKEVQNTGGLFVNSMDQAGFYIGAIFLALIFLFIIGVFWKQVKS